MTIPNDILQAARDVRQALITTNEFPEMTIARAILAERRRCAARAHKYLKDLAGCSPNDDEPELIAAAVMNPDWSPPPL